MNECDEVLPRFDLIFRPEADLLQQAYKLRPRAWRARVAQFPDIAAWTDVFDECSDHWVIVVDNRVVAAARLTVRDSIEDLPHPELYRDFHIMAAAPVASINRLVVAHEYAGKGLSGRLDEARVMFADSAGVSLVLATTFAGDRRVANLKSLGFVELGLAGSYTDGPLTQINVEKGRGRLLVRSTSVCVNQHLDDARLV